MPRGLPSGPGHRRTAARPAALLHAIIGSLAFGDIRSVIQFIPAPAESLPKRRSLQPPVHAPRGKAGGGGWPYFYSR